MIHCRQGRYGFTLLEMSVVLLILSLMLGGILAALTQESRRNQREQLKIKMDAIEEALLTYSKRSDHYNLPCPAQILPASNASFGIADAAGCAAIPATYNDSVSAAGTVPVRTLGLSDDYAFDPWGNLFQYVVSVNSTIASAFTTSNPTVTGLAKIEVHDLTDTLISDIVAVAIISYGQDGFGSFTREGVRKYAYSTNAYQLVNCHCLVSGAGAVTDDSYASIYYMGANTPTSSDVDGGFDDVVRIYKREFFLLSSDIATEKP